MSVELTKSVRNETSKYLGICFIEAKIIFINVRKFASFENLKHTIVHELVHYRFRYLRHGQRFEKRVSLILKGKRYRPLYVCNTLSKNDKANDNNNNRSGGA
jgi:predicted metal-dependent hydrolase